MMNDTHMRHTAYLVAHAYTDPNGKMLPQIHAVRIYSESATSLSLSPKNTASLDVYSMRGDTYQEASDRICHAAQTLDVFAWCRPLMDPRYAEPIDYLCLEVETLDATKLLALHDVLCNTLRCSLVVARRCIREGVGPLVRLSVVEAINAAQQTARAWLKRDFDAKNSQ